MIAATISVLLPKLGAQPNQVTIERVELMPDLPQPFQMRNWKKVAQQYDSILFNQNLSGTYLPLVEINQNGINYPALGNFVLPSYVGSSKPWSGEAINQIAAVLGASLVGIDKTNQFGQNWVALCQDFFNNRAEENVYLNNFSARSGNDWWYDTMPNVYYYQLSTLVPPASLNYFDEQFETIADRWFEALKYMGAGATPWQIPNFNHRAWYLSTMQPNDNGVKEPEAAGALGWLMYMAYLRTNNKKYLMATEWCLEFLNQWTVNPSYELQLPYGVYTAARLNAELHTDYDLQKMLNWCFNPEDNVRNWGVTVGNWGGYDCAGLVGEVIGDNYAFAMNTFEMVGALAPVARYDERFARALAKWILNAANAARLFYHPFLPDENQDSEAWSKIYDPSGVIAYEALREKDWYSDKSPFATGDAVRNGWAATNLALYGASHVGILGALIDTTNVEGVLKLNVHKLDYFSMGGSRSSHPYFLIYNPYQNDTLINLQLGSTDVDVYDLVSNRDLLQNVQGEVQISVPADEAILITLLKSDAQRTFEQGVLLVDGEKIDYHTDQSPVNLAPRIKALAPEEETIIINGKLKVFCTAVDADGDSLKYFWKSERGQIVGQGPVVQWQAPSEQGRSAITCQVSDPFGATDSARILISVIANQNPVIKQMGLSPDIAVPGESVNFYCQAEDADGDSLDCLWMLEDGRVLSRDFNWQWTVPDTGGYLTVYCQVTDGKGGQALDSLGLSVGHLVVHYRFEQGTARDVSPFKNNGLAENVSSVPTPDGLGLFFDGSSSLVKIKNHPSLNFRDEISVAFYIRVDSFFTREAYPVSHGNWERRWKISITNKRLRWTIKTENSIYDLDSRVILEGDRFYFVTCTYNSATEQMAIYLNGQLDNASSARGRLLTTEYDLCLGRHLPQNADYSFLGVLDDFYLFNKALNDQEIKTLYDTLTTLGGERLKVLPTEFTLKQNFPNPFNPQTQIAYYLPAAGQVRLTIFDTQGRTIESVPLGQGSPGWHVYYWKPNGLASGVYFYRLQWRNRQKVRKCLFIK